MLFQLFGNKVTNLVAMILGVLQLALPIFKEALVVVARICGVIFFWTDVDERVIKKMNEIYDLIYNLYEQFKNMWLAMYR